MKITPIIGLEIHIQIKTQTKAFCGCSTNYFGHEPNTHVCAVCMGLPGALPVPSKELIYRAIRLGLALDPTKTGKNISKYTQFDRKNYFYPDLPKGYQISQYYHPIIIGGEVQITGKTIHIAEAHIEEDAAKSTHESTRTLIDYNKSSMPLFEIVSAPEMQSGLEAEEYAKNIQQIIRYIGISDADIEKGSMRVEPTINVKIESDDGNTVYTPLVEIKNIASLKFARDAIEYEIKRQVRQYQEDGIVKSSTNKTTRGWDSQKSATFPQRDKEGAADYRYFPEPDIPPIVITEEMITSQKELLPELPVEKVARFTSLGVSEVDAKIIALNLEFAQKFDSIIDANGDKEFVKFVANRFLGSAKPTIESAKTLSKKLFSDAYEAVKNGHATANAINVALEQALSTDKPLTNFYTPQVSDTDAIELIARQVINANPKAVEDYKKNPNSIGFLVGAVMKESRGSANPALARQILEKIIKV